MQNVISIRQAERQGARLVVGLSGISGSGKTYTALQLAYGLANYDASKVGLLDTENRRGSLYSDCLVDPETGEVQRFLIGDLDAPFSPDRYIQAIHQFQEAGVEVLVIDSTTHEWEGTGGCEEIAYSGNPRMPDWATAKREHKRFMNALLQSDMHVIPCIRAREKVSVEKQGGRTVVTPLGIMPVQEKNFMFEMTASLMMVNAGKSQQVLKCPEELRQILGRGDGYITPADGKALRDWVDGAKKLDPEVEKYRNRLRSVTEKGLVHVKECWNKTPANIRKALGQGFQDNLFSAAQAFDEGRTEDGKQQLEDLNNQVMSGRQ